MNCPPASSAIPTQKGPHPQANAGLSSVLRAFPAGLRARNSRPLRLGAQPDALVLLVPVHRAAEEDAEGVRAALLQELFPGLVEDSGNLVRAEIGLSASRGTA